MPELWIGDSGRLATQGCGSFAGFRRTLYGAPLRAYQSVVNGYCDGRPRPRLKSEPGPPSAFVEFFDTDKLVLWGAGFFAGHEAAGAEDGEVGGIALINVDEGRV